jgi:hypothetical protein
MSDQDWTLIVKRNHESFKQEEQTKLKQLEQSKSTLRQELQGQVRMKEQMRLDQLQKDKIEF